MTGTGTTTFLLGEGRDIAVIDPGPDDAAHLSAILAALDPGQQISHIFVTHAHLDHSALARPLALVTRAPILAFGPPEAGRSPLMQHLADLGHLGGGEGVDTAFIPDITLADGDSVSGSDWTLAAQHTPGHMASHLSFGWGDRLFCGDAVMGWASTLISPPDGDVGAYRASLRRMAAQGWRTLYPTHGPEITNPSARIAALLQHRQTRETLILQAVIAGNRDLHSITAAAYHDTPAPLLRAASRNCLAHLVDLTERTIISARPAPTPTAIFTPN